LADLFDDEVALLPEFRGHSVYWLYHDNYLAAKVLAKSHPKLATSIADAITANGADSSGKIEILFGESKHPLPFRHHDLIEVKRIGRRIIKTERVKSKTFAGWQAYADLLFLASIANAKKHPQQADRQFAAAMKMWDGTGFADAVVPGSKRYATYKLALACIAAKRLDKHRSLPPELLPRLLTLQANTGGWITDYRKDGTPVGKANVETSCLAILAIEGVF
jgi:hypothetical protein